MSALPPKADIRDRDWHVRFVPKADIGKKGWDIRSAGTDRSALLVAVLLLSHVEGRPINSAKTVTGAWSEPPSQIAASLILRTRGKHAHNVGLWLEIRNPFLGHERNMALSLPSK
jgi:hypothetical protein